MNTQQAKKIPIPEIMSALGYEPKRYKGDEVLYPSPFRDERNPSFWVNIKKNVWIDFGLSKGDGSGNGLDLVMKARNVTLEGALKVLDGMNLKGSAYVCSAQKSFEFSKDVSKLVLVDLVDLGHPALIQYLDSRGISLEIARKYLKEIYYTRNGESFFSLAFPSDSGGYESRNFRFKGFLDFGKKKDVSFIPAKSKPGYALHIFEGFMDFLSSVEHFGKHPENDVLVLNSTALVGRVKDRLKDYKAVCCFLDNNEAGKEASQEIERIASEYGVRVVDKSGLYKGFEDFNEFLVYQRRGLER